ncbi:hypothetical protein FEM48_Zijuj03G0078300 [Ziziphus jujuba var. spinosa]|uniref:Serine aminopeptidase S33 domain-containing protein n=1 Tax=Ziziphus jujuba var. spinosa TaxID=714518 RepID=A0A978VP27_ZIZJJ|nr:hypothetical protein FEM48_Zijuj03G0078300 [Ziziphus jujuba var. spinosa]
MASQAENVVYEEHHNGQFSISKTIYTYIYTYTLKTLKESFGLDWISGTARRLVQAGYAMYGMDYEGHGKSAGLQGYVESFDNVVDDVSDHYTSICEKKENRKKLRFLMGESMGGAMALQVHRKKPEYWDGAVLVAPMCKIADEMKPSPMVVNALVKLSRVIPTWKVIPSNDVIDSAFKVPEVREQVRANQYCYKGRPRLKTGYELLRVSTDIEKNLNEVSLPFLVLHGEDDKVTDKSVSKQLYEVASSKDKTLKLYPGMWHGLLYGEPPENLEIVFSDIIGWLNEKVTSGNARLENELKNENDKSVQDH